MRGIQISEHYTDIGDFAVMTRTSVLKYSQLARIAGHLCRNAEELVSSTDTPTNDNLSIAGMMMSWAYTLVPVNIATRFDY